MSAPPHIAETSPGTRGAVGLPGAGKTRGIRRGIRAAVLEGIPVCVLDLTDEWQQADPEVAVIAARVESPEHAIAALESGARLAIVSATGDEDRDRETADELGRWALATEEVRGLAIPEVHNVAPNNGKVAPSLVKIATAWRHRRVLMWWDSQRIALVSRHLTDLSRELRLYAVSGDVDLRTVRSLGTDGDDPAGAP